MLEDAAVGLRITIIPSDCAEKIASTMISSGRDTCSDELVPPLLDTPRSEVDRVCDFRRPGGVTASDALCPPVLVRARAALYG